MQLIQFIKLSVHQPEKQIENVLQLLAEGATIPFIARYRKERTGNMDEVEITQIRDAQNKYQEIISRQETIIKAIDEQGQLSEKLKQDIQNAFDLTMLEDLYLPYKKKRETRGEKAKKLGLEPLAKMIMSQRLQDPYSKATDFINNKVASEEEAINGALDIIAEYINENTVTRNWLRDLFRNRATLETKIKDKGKDSEEKYRDLYQFNKPLKFVSSHRFLAASRGANEGILSFKIAPTKEEALEKLERFFVKERNECGELVKKACKDAYSRLIASSIETEIFNEFKEKADAQAIGIFTTNLRQMLLASPLGQKRVLAIDPGFRTGCKVVCLDQHGTLLTNTTIYPHPPQNEFGEAKKKLSQLVEAYQIEAIAIGDGTAGRETETLVKRTSFSKEVQVFSVREDGASIYSASSIARKEFPTYDVTVRGAVSIGRRLMDPMAELVKIDPKSIGVGQYQHEVNQHQLKTALDDVVISAVNAVGVDLNTASPYLLSYVSGLNLTTAENIVEKRDELGGFTSREQLKKVKRLGDKTFEQCAGFLRIRESKNPLDNSAIHPESYHWIEKFAKHLQLKTEDLIENENAINQLKHTDFQEIDNYTFNDLIAELKKPSRDIRQKIKILEFDENIKTIQDLKVGQILNGMITNITDFGAFVNIGIKENGLIHKSNLSEDYIENPTDIVKLNQAVRVEVLSVEIERKRIGLKML